MTDTATATPAALLNAVLAATEDAGYRLVDAPRAARTIDLARSTTLQTPIVDIAMVLTDGQFPNDAAMAVASGIFTLVRGFDRVVEQHEQAPAVIPQGIGDAVATAAQLDALPANAILQSTDGEFAGVAHKRATDVRNAWNVTRHQWAMPAAQLLTLATSWQIVAVGDCVHCSAVAPVTAAEHEPFCIEVQDDDCC